MIEYKALVPRSGSMVETRKVMTPVEVKGDRMGEGGGGMVYILNSFR